MRKLPSSTSVITVAARFGIGVARLFIVAAALFFLIAAAFFSPVFAVSPRPFDWHYNRLSAPFAVFYNPSILGGNPGYTIGIDTRSDSVGYDVRGALVIPVSRVMRREYHLRHNDGNRFFRYANVPYRSSGSAISLGGIYAGPEDYRLSGGFVTPVYLVQTGASFDIVYRDEHPVISGTMAFSADMLGRMDGRVFYLALNNFVASERDGTNDLGISVGTAGFSPSNPRLFFTPYDLFFTGYVKNGVMDRVEGTARFSLDLTTLYTSEEITGQLPSLSAGYGFTRLRGGEVSHRFFVNFGIVFINRSSSAAILGSYGGDREKHAGFIYSSHTGGERRIGSDNNLAAALSSGVTGNGDVLFTANTAGTTVRSWVLRIEDQRGGSIRTFSGGNTVPSSILWDGLTSAGATVNDEIVYAKLVLKGNNRVVESNSVSVEYRNGRPVAPAAE
jgi:hypothetical protein